MQQISTKNNFSWVRMSIEDMKALPQKYIEYKKRIYSDIKKINPEHRTFQNTVLGILNSDKYFDSKGMLIDYSDTVHQIGLLSNVHTDANFRNIANQVITEISQKMVDIEYDKGLYIALLEYEMGNYEDECKGLSLDIFTSEENKKNITKNKVNSKTGKQTIKLDEIDKKVFIDMLKGYKRMGFDLSEDKQKLLKSKLKELAKVSSGFRKNINDYQDHILCSREELSGCSERFISSLEKLEIKNKKGESEYKYKVTLEYPHVGPFLANAENREKRKELTIKNSKKGGKKNLIILKKMVDLRIEIAKILGYKNYIDFKVEDRMAKNSQNVLDFNNRLLEKVKPAGDRDTKELKTYAKKLGINSLEAWDISYVQNKLKKEKFNIESEELRPYFELQYILNSMFTLAENLFNIKFVKQNIKTWDDEVIVLEVQDNNTENIESTENAENVKNEKNVDKKKVLANLVLDLYPRTGKYGHAAAFDTKYEDIKTVTLVCNFPKPNIEHPSLLSLGEVETMYHEFGHALHFMLSETKYTELNGFNVTWDFVEAPSQMFENFIWNAESLKQISKHYKTKKSLDDLTIKNILDSKKFMNGMGTMSQLLNAKLDLDIHNNKVKSKNGLEYAAYFQNLKKKYLDMSVVKESLFPAGFGHMDGYDSGYYSYMWALIYAQDFYSIFEKSRIEDNKNGDNSINVSSKQKLTGLKYRKEILGVGSSRDEVLSAKKFLGREMNEKAFLKELGIS